MQELKWDIQLQGSNREEGINIVQPLNATDYSFLAVFLLWMPVDLIENNVVMKTSSLLKEAGEAGTFLGGFLVFCGVLLLLMSIDFTQCEFFRSHEYNEKDFPCPYHLSKAVVLSSFSSAQNSPQYRDHFWKVCQMLATIKNTLWKPLSHLGSPASMSPCLSGTLNGPARDGYSVKNATSPRQ